MASRASDQGDHFEHLVKLDQRRYDGVSDFGPVRAFLRSDRATGEHTMFWDEHDNVFYAFTDANTAFAFKLEFG